MRFFYYIAGTICAISLCVFLAGIVAIIRVRRGNNCTQKGTAARLRVKKTTGRNETRWLEIADTDDGVACKTMVDAEQAEGFGAETPAGTRLPIRYDPDKPEQVIIGEEPSMTKTVKAWKRILKCSLICMLISLGVFVFALSRGEETADLPRNTATIGALSQELSALAGKQPDKLIFTESISAPATFRITVDDPGEAEKVLNILLNTPVSRQGCQVDMAQYRYEEYCFVFGEETFSFGFLPYSYFCYNGQDYELGENRLTSLCDSLHEMAAEAETAQWYGADSELLTRFVDNGDEARSVTELTLYAGEDCFTGVIEGAYDVLSIEKQSDCYVIRYTYGDYNSHAGIRSSRVTVENGEMIITDIGQQ